MCDNSWMHPVLNAFRSAFPYMLASSRILTSETAAPASGLSLDWVVEGGG